MALSIASVFSLMATVGQGLLLTPAGSEFIQTRSQFIDHVSNSQAMTDSDGLLCHLMFRFGSTQLCVLRPEALAPASLMTLTSGYYEGSRNSFQPFEEMFQVNGGTPVSWIFSQDPEADAGRKKLNAFFSATVQEQLDSIIQEETSTFIEKLSTTERDAWTTADWYESVHEFVIRVFARHVLGLQYIPEHVAELITATETALFNETPTFKVAGYEVRFTASQRRFAHARANFVVLADTLLADSRNLEIFKDPNAGYLSFLLNERSIATGRSITELLQDVNELAWIRATIAGFLLGVGNFASSVTLGLAHLDSLETNPMDHVFKEVVRLLTGQISRFTSHELRLSKATDLARGAVDPEIIIPPNSFIFVDYRGASLSERLWADPMKFNPSRFLAGGHKIHTTEFSPFSMGRRMCPAGPATARAAFSQILESIRRQVRIELEYPELLRDLAHWTTEDFVTRPREPVRARLIHL